MRDDFGVRVAREPYASRLELALQRHVVLDDAVVDDCDLAGDVRVSIGFARPAVRSPARMADPGRSLKGGLAERSVEIGELAHGANDRQSASRVNRETRRIVAAVFEPSQPFDEDGNGVLPANISHDPAHLVRSPLKLVSRLPVTPDASVRFPEGID